MFLEKSISKSRTIVEKWSNYTAFGQDINARSYSIGGQKYRYNFNGKESTVEDDFDAYDFGARSFDQRLGRWMSIDAHAGKYPGITPYNFSYNNPIIFNDPDGNDGRLTIDQATHSITLETVIHLYGPSADDDLAKQLNTNYSIISPSARVFIDDNNQEWTVNIKITYDIINKAVLDEMTQGMNFDGSNNSVPTLSDIDVKKLKNFEDGDNIMYVDKDKPIVLSNGFSPAGFTGQGKNGSIIGYGESDRTYIHEAFHQLGFDERYLSFYYHQDFENDVMGFGKANVKDLEIHPQHYMTLVKFAGKGKSYNKKVLNSKRLDNTSGGKTETGRETAQKYRARERKNSGGKTNSRYNLQKRKGVSNQNKSSVQSKKK